MPKTGMRGCHPSQPLSDMARNPQNGSSAFMMTLSKARALQNLLSQYDNNTSVVIEARAARKVVVGRKVFASRNIFVPKAVLAKAYFQHSPIKAQPQRRRQCCICLVECIAWQRPVLRTLISTIRREFIMCAECLLLTIHHHRRPHNALAYLKTSFSSTTYRQEARHSPIPSPASYLSQLVQS